MTPSPQRLYDLLEQARRLPRDTQERFVIEAAADEPELAREALATLRSQGAEGGSVHSTATDALLAKLQRAPKLDTERFVMEGEIDRGGMGAVLRIHDAHLNRRLAMKVMLEGAAAADRDETRLAQQLLGRFLEEAQVTSQLDHPGVVPVHELGLDASGKVYFTMRLVKGKNASLVFALARDEQEGWTRTRALEVVLKVCDTMAYAHEKGALHRDLKPANVMVGRFGEVYVMDWGLAKVLGEDDKHDLRIMDQKIVSSLAVETARNADLVVGEGSPVMTMGGQTLGTPCYMSPEQARSEELDVRADVYSIGAMMYELLTGRAPYTLPGQRRRAYDVLEDVIDKAPRRIEEITKGVAAELVAIVEKAMARERDERYSGVLDLADDLRAFVDQRVVRVYRTGALIEMRMWTRRNRGLARSLAAAVLILMAGIVGIAAFARLAMKAKRELEQSSYVANVQMAGVHLDQRDLGPLRERLAACPKRLRGWEWDWLHSASDQSLAILKGHTGRLCFAQFSPDGARVVTASSDGRARIWRAIDGAVLTELETGELSLDFVTFSPDGSRIATASWAGTAQIWDAETGALLAKLGESRECTDFAQFSPDGRRVLTNTSATSARIWNAGTGALEAELTGHTGEIASASFSFDGLRVVTASNDMTACIWNAANGTLLVELKGHTNELASASFSPDGTRIVTASEDTTGRIWDAATGAVLAELKGHRSGVNSASFSPDGTHVVTASMDGSARIWNGATGAVSAELWGHWDGVLMARYSPDGTRVLTASLDSSARLWDAAAGLQILALRGHAEVVRSATFDPSGTRVVTASDDMTARIWDAESGTASGELTRQGSLLISASFSPDGSCIVATCSDGVARIWDTSTLSLLSELKGHSKELLYASFSPDSTRVVTAAKDTTARLWDTATGESLAVLNGHNGDVVSAVFSPDGRRIVTASHDMTARTWNAATGSPLAILNGHKKELLSAVFSSEGRLVNTASLDGSIRLWSAETGAALDDGYIRTDNHGFKSFSRDGTRVVTGDDFENAAIIWNTASGAIVAKLRGHAGRIIAASFSPDGTHVVTASEDMTARIWQAASGRVVAELKGHTERVDFASFSPDGMRVVTTSFDGTARIWDVATGAAFAKLVDKGWFRESVSFSQDGGRLVTVSRDGFARIWNTVPYRDRFPAIQKTRQLLAMMRSQVTQRLDAGEDQLAVRQSMIADATLTSDERTAAMIAVQAWLDSKGEQK